MISFFGDVLPHREEMKQFDSVSRAFRTPSRQALANADLIATMTEHCRGLASHVGISPGEVALVRVAGRMTPFNPDVEGAAVRARYADRDGPLLLFVGQIRPRKGPGILIEALAAIRRRHPDARALFVGPDHGYVDELRETAVGLQVDDAVDFVGAVEDEELPAYYAAADVFVFPTLTAIECLGLTFVQAMFSGTPVVATRIAGAPEIIRDGHDGFLVEPGDSAALAERLTHVLELPPGERAAVAARGRERAATLLNEQSVLEDLLGAYERLL
jgi:phosphatidyl-myo-inositol dimannoside synthase